MAIAYAEAAIADRKGERFCKWVRLAAKRFLGDLKRAKGKRAAYRFDAWPACDACDFIEKLPHVEGKWETPTITLDPFQVFFVVNLFGFRNPDGTRRFTSALLAVARKNAKSTLAAGILLYCQCCEEEPGPQIVSAATTGDQARIVFNVAKRMVEKTPDLQSAFDIKPFANAIASFRNGGSFKPINAKASTQDGLNPSATVLDEVHAHKTAELLDVLQSAAGARRNPLWLYTTTEGYETPGPWPELRKFSQQVLEGVVEADHFLALIYALDDESTDVLDEIDALQELEESCNCGLVQPIQIAQCWREACAASAIAVGTMPTGEDSAKTILREKPKLGACAEVVTSNGRLSAAQTRNTGNGSTRQHGGAETRTRLARLKNGGKKKTSGTQSSGRGSQNTASHQSFTNGSVSSRAVNAQSAAAFKKLYAWITATIRGKFEGCSAGSAILQSVFSETISRVYGAHSPTCAARQNTILEDGKLHIRRPADDDFDQSKFVKANPLLDASPILQRELGKAAAEAKAMPGRLAEFRIKRLNRQSASAAGWIDLPKWKRCGGEVDLEALADAQCFAALDLASTTDMAAWRLIWIVEGRVLTWGRRWVPEAAVERRALRGTVPYEAWRGAGLIETTPGDVIDYEVIEARIREDVERFKPEMIAFDRWNAIDLVNRLTKDDLPMIEFVQGPKSYHPAMQELERLYRSEKLVHGGDPVLQWCASNLVVRYDANMNMAPDKKRSPEKIDDMAALLMAIGVSMGQPEDAPVTLGSDYSLVVA